MLVSASQLRTATVWPAFAPPIQPAGGTLACRPDALQVLFAALADRDQLGPDLHAAIDRQADGVRLPGVGLSFSPLVEIRRVPKRV